MLDWLVYAPLGALSVAVEELPRLAERGHERFGRQINAAGLIGRFAVAEAVRRFSPPSQGPDYHPVTDSRQEEGPLAATPGLAKPRPPFPTGGSQPGRIAGPSPRARDGEPGGTTPSRQGGRRRTSLPPEPARSAPDIELPIPGYDTLAASQVVERLASLSPAELEAVRKHESATRRRRTVLHRIAQLNAERDGASA